MSSLYNPTVTNAMAICMLPVHPRGDFVNRAEHDRLAGAHWYVVTKGRKLGAFTHHEDAEEQIRNYSGGERFAFATYAEAKSHWADHCFANHLPWCSYWYEQNHVDNVVRWGVKGLSDLFNTEDDAHWAARYRGLPPDDVSLINCPSHLVQISRSPPPTFCARFAEKQRNVLLLTMTCLPRFFPSSPEFNREEHDCRADRKYYCVDSGRVEGIYDNDADALAQVYGVTDSHQRSTRTYEQAVALWVTHCQTHHGIPCPYAAAQHHPQGILKWAVKGVWDLFATKAEAVNAAAVNSLPYADEYLRSSTNEVLLNNFARGV
ncbi:hypothetical protein C8J57DRAFT_1507212 [Mycena rebaudengoi]|nr:hypothetical protein C8J57DRAFT_1507212 [Mycena rebaudengoi]